MKHYMTTVNDYVLGYPRQSEILFLESKTREYNRVLQQSRAKSSFALGKKGYPMNYNSSLLVPEQSLYDQCKESVLAAATEHALKVTVAEFPGRIITKIEVPAYLAVKWSAYKVGGYSGVLVMAPYTISPPRISDIRVTTMKRESLKLKTTDINEILEECV